MVSQVAHSNKTQSIHLGIFEYTFGYIIGSVDYLKERSGRKIQNQQIGIDFNKRESHSRHRIYIWVYSNIHLGILLGSVGIYIWVYY